MQGRSEVERRAILPCLNVATWRRDRSDRAIKQIRKLQRNQVPAASSGSLYFGPDSGRFGGKIPADGSTTTPSSIRPLKPKYQREIHGAGLTS